MGQRIKAVYSAGAFLKRDGLYLLMKRGLDRKRFPGLWSNIGGGIEAHELYDPQQACLREILEESGIQPHEVFNLELRYVIISRIKDVLRYSYIYFGETDAVELMETEEGTLHWVPEDELLDREYSPTFTAMMRHYLETPEDGRVVIGVVENRGGSVNWSVADDIA